MGFRRVTMLGAGLIAGAYTAAIHNRRAADRVRVVYSRTAGTAAAFAARHGIEHSTADLAAAVGHPDTDVVVVALPNARHEEAVELAARAGKAVLCTKPLGRSAAEAARMLATVERAGVFAGYLEDLCYPPKTTAAVAAVRAGAIGDVHWVRSRGVHGGPHSPWFLDRAQAGGGALIDMGSHGVEIVRAFVGKHDRPVEVACWTETRGHRIEVEDHAVALIRFAGGALGQVEASWAFRGGMDLREEVTGATGSVRLDHFLRTGFELFSADPAAAVDAVVTEKAEAGSGWRFPVGDETAELGNVDMFVDMFDAMESGRPPRETFYDGYVVNAILDACYLAAESGRWEPVELDWREPVAA